MGAVGVQQVPQVLGEVLWVEVGVLGVPQGCYLAAEEAVAGVEAEEVAEAGVLRFCYLGRRRGLRSTRGLHRCLIWRCCLHLKFKKHIMDTLS